MSTSEHPVLEPTVRSCRNAVVMPMVPYGHEESTTRGGPFGRWIGGVYSDGVPVPEALALRFIEVGEQGWYHQPHQPELQAPYIAPAEQHGGGHIYCGRLIDQFGHFILESLARIWLAKRHPDWTLVWTGADSYRPWQQEILELLGIHNPARFVQQPTGFESLAVPSAGYILSTFYTPYFLETLGVIEPKPVVPGRKVYLSRSRGRTGGYVNEAEIDTLLAAQGWTILHPEALPVAERFDLLSSAETILMIQGAAFVSLLLFRSLQSRLYTLSRGDSELFADQIWFAEFMDALAGTKSFHYHRLDLPKQHVYGGDCAARYALDMARFSELMEQTGYLSGPLEPLARYDQPIDFDPEEALRLAEASRRAVTTACPPVVDHLYRSARFEASGDLGAALDEAEKGAVASPDSAYVQGVFARLLMQQEEWARAEEAMLKAIALEVYDTPGNHIQLLHIYANQGKLEQAVAAGERAVHLDSATPSCWLGLAHALLHSDRLEEAEEAFQKALTLDAVDSSVEAHLGLSHLYVRQGELERGLKAIEEAIGRDDQRAELHQQRGALLMAQGDLQNAEAAQRRALELEPDLAEARQQLAAIRCVQAPSLDDSAEGSGESVWELDALDAPSLLSLGHTLLHRGRTEEAERAFEKALAIDAAAAWVDAHSGLSHLYALRGELERALNGVREAMVRDDQRPELHHHLGILLMALGDWRGAEQAQLQALELQPDFAPATQQLAIIRSATALRLSDKLRSGWSWVRNTAFAMIKRYPR